MNNSVKDYKNEFGIQENYLYEILATTFSTNKESNIIQPNTSCMGIRLKKNNNFIMRPYSTTQTFQNLESNNCVVFNFVDNIYLYALAALKQPQSKNNFEVFPEKYYKFINQSELQKLKNNFPINSNKIQYINQAWGIIFGIVVDKTRIEKKDGLGKIELTEFKIKPVFTKKLHQTYKLYNRAENLTLEMIILATRLRIAHQNKDKNKITSIKRKITEYEKEISRFSQNKQVFRTIKFIKQYYSALDYI